MRNRERRGKPVRVAEVLDDVLAELGLKERLAERELLLAWPRVVGARIARCSRAVDIEDGILTLQADHPAWRQELTLLVPSIIARYNEMFGPGSVREIRWDRSLPRRRRDDDGS
jgi:predicted nucleic acid-binding Zn ribbon protein